MFNFKHLSAPLTESKARPATSSSEEGVWLASLGFTERRGTEDDPPPVRAAFSYFLAHEGSELCGSRGHL